ncbi:outer dense fiber protein 3-like [Rana temporaria]|uniref:outer dense fiber protein 3-like n=1 Tax=Rana temporaria TaxID=8407 RepID=UPI001AAC8EB5|nr:outer dense fiber protein 3-like [Rana temporaria]XP_040199103.1 outer dense fiber protein 3-like [Rana temporaria]
MTSEAYIGTWRPHRPIGPISALYTSPGPKYALPGTTGYNQHDPSKYRAPAYSAGIRRLIFDDNCSPGPKYLVPANITIRGKVGTPAYSLYGRPKDLNAFSTPGPGSYVIESAEKYAYRSAPKYSLGSRTRTFSNDQTPGPAAYTLPPVLGPEIVSKSSAPNFSMIGRSKIGSFHEDLQKTPGPGTYRTVEPSTYKYKPPKYSMTARNSLPGDTTQKPGPGAHSPEKVHLSQRQAPRFSFGMRHSEYVTPLIVDVKD